MSGTLISSVGRGQKDGASATYDRVSYVIDGHSQPPTPFFVNAWLFSDQGRDIDQVHLIGTATSSWSALVEEFRIQDLELWNHLEERCGEQSGPGVTDEDLKPVARILERHWHRKVACHVLCHREIDDSTADAILTSLLELFPLREKTRHLVLDTTHALRTLPLLALSAVQLADALSPGFAARTRLIYGERLGRGSEARGISLDKVLERQRLADALRVFLDAYDAEPLAEQIRPVHPEMAMALEALGQALACNAFEHLHNRVRRVIRALDVPPGISVPWWQPFRSTLRNFVVPLDHASLPQQLLAVADLHADRRQYAMALLALAESASALACPVKLDSHEAMKQAMADYSRSLSAALRKDWDYLQYRRNAVAHGANRADGGGSNPMSARSIVSQARVGLLRLLTHHGQLR